MNLNTLNLYGFYQIHEFDEKHLEFAKRTASATIDHPNE